jgi:hypothetical protein
MSESFHSKRQSNPCTGLKKPRGFQVFDVHRFQESQHMKVVRLSALGTAAFTAQKTFLAQTELIPGLYRHRKDYAKRTRDLPVCSAVTQPSSHGAPL